MPPKAVDFAVEELADRIRAEIGDRPHVREQRMFGGIAFMLNGNMLVGPIKGGSLLVRVGKDGYDAALTLPGASPMRMGERTMSGFVEISGDTLETEEQLTEWITRAETFVRTLPPK